LPDGRLGRKGREAPPEGGRKFGGARRPSERAAMPLEPHCQLLYGFESTIG